MKLDEIISLAISLGFEVKEAQFLDTTLASVMMINETKDKIIYFSSNKVILYNYKLDKNTIASTIEHQIYSYLKYKTSNPLVLTENDKIVNDDRKKISDEFITQIPDNKDRKILLKQFISRNSKKN